MADGNFPVYYGMLIFLSGSEQEHFHAHNFMD